MADTQTLELQASSFEATVQAATRPVLIDFWAPWCGSCRLLAPTVHRLSREWAGRLDVYTLDVAAAPDIARARNVQTLPTLLLLKQGQEIKRLSGTRNFAALTAEIDAIV